MVGELIASGVYIGLLYSFAGLSLAVVYKSSRVMNFGLGGVGVAALYVAHLLAEHHVPAVVQVLAGGAVGAALGLLTEALIITPLRRRPPIVSGLATLGVMLICQGVVITLAGVQSYGIPPMLSDSHHVTVLGVRVPILDIVVLCVVLVVMVALYQLLRARFGVAIRATASGPRTAQLLGTRIRSVFVVSWTLGGFIGGIGAVLAGPMIFVSPDSYPQFLFSAFVAVVLGGFTSIGGIVIGSIVFGVALSLAEVYISSNYPFTMTLVVLLVLLLVRPHGVFGRQEHDVVEPDLPLRGSALGGRLASRAVGAWHDLWRGLAARGRAASTVAGPAFVRRDVATASILLVACGVLPWIAPIGLASLLPAVMAMYVASLGLNIINGYCKQVTIGQGAFMALGAYTAAVATVHGHVPFVVSMLIATAVGALAGLVLALPAVRLDGLYLALITLIFAFTVPEVIIQLGGITGGAIGIEVPLPPWLGSLNGQYWFNWLIALIATAVVAALLSGPVLRRWRIVGDTDAGARAIGVSPSRVKAGAYSIGGALGGLGGAMLVVSVNFVSPDSFDIWMSVYLLVATTVGGMESVLGCLLGAWFIQVGPLYFQDLGLTPQIAYGLLLIIVLVGMPGGVNRAIVGLIAAVGDGMRWMSGRVRRGEAPPLSGVAVDGDDGSAADAGGAVARGRPASDRPPLLRVDRVSVSYTSGARALSVFSCAVGEGEQVAILGPNGAGKSTLARAVSGQVGTGTGTVFWRGRPAGSAGPDAVSRMGIVQVPEGRGIFPDLTVAENLRLVRRAQARAAASDDGSAGRVTYGDEAIFSMFPALIALRSRRAGTLSGGEQQMLAIARGLAASPRLLMLDEPSLGLSPKIAGAVYAELASLGAQGLSMLVIEQNTSLALGLCSRAYILASGTCVAEGDAGALREGEELVRHYLGAGR